MIADPRYGVRSLHARINARGFEEQRGVLPLAQALFDGGYEKKWRAAVRRAQDIRRAQRRMAEKAMGLLPRRSR